MNPLIGCFYRGVDSTELILFLGIIIGCGVGSLILFIVWGILTGHLSSERHLASAPLEAEGDDQIPLEDIP